jgi:hypothetical protein
VAISLGAILVSGAQASTFKLVPSDGLPLDQFGVSTAISGGTVVVGAVAHDTDGTADQGAAYVFVRSGSDWIQQQKLTASDGAGRDGFGAAVATSGDTIVVGAWGDDNFRGSAYVFVRTNGVWVEQQKLVASDGALGDRFGFSLAMSPDTIVIGAFADDDDGVAPFFRGSAYVFDRTDLGWIERQKLTASDGVGGDFFGRSVAIDNDTIVIGAEFDDLNAPFDDRGSAYVFVRIDGTWWEQQKLTASDGASQDQFGASVAVSGNTIVVGAESDDLGANANQGSAYVFTRSGNVWAQQQKLTAIDGSPNDKFGFSVAIRGDAIAIGTDVDDVGTNIDQGSLYLFVRNDGVWVEHMKLVADDGAAGDRFGYSVAIDSMGIVTGAWGDDIFRGSAYVFATATPAEAIQALINQIDADPDLGQGVKASLTAPLGAAIAILSDSNVRNDRAACGQLNAFVNQVSAHGLRVRLTAALADALRASAAAIEAALGCAQASQ